MEEEIEKKEKTIPEPLIKRGAEVNCIYQPNSFSFSNIRYLWDDKDKVIIDSNGLILDWDFKVITRISQKLIYENLIKDENKGRYYKLDVSKARRRTRDYYTFNDEAKKISLKPERFSDVNLICEEIEFNDLNSHSPKTFTCNTKMYYYSGKTSINRIILPYSLLPKHKEFLEESKEEITKSELEEIVRLNSCFFDSFKPVDYDAVRKLEESLIHVFGKDDVAINIDESETPTVEAVIRFPEVQITNENENVYDIYNLFVSITFNGAVNRAHLMRGNKSSFLNSDVTSFEKYDCDDEDCDCDGNHFDHLYAYLHSHLPNELEESHTFNPFCLGSTDLNIMMMDLQNNGIAHDSQLELLFLMIKDYVYWESLEGGPYISIGDLNGSFHQDYFGSERCRALFDDDVLGSIDEVPVTIDYSNNSVKIDQDKLNNILLPILEKKYGDRFLSSINSSGVRCKISYGNDGIHAGLKHMQDNFIAIKFGNERIDFEFIEENNKKNLNKVVNSHVVDGISTKLNKILNEKECKKRLFAVN